MLVLSRRNQESVVVGAADGFQRLLTVTVLAINGGRVRLGFEADASVLVHRGEIWERIGTEVNPSEAGSDQHEQASDCR